MCEERKRRLAKLRSSLVVSGMTEDGAGRPQVMPRATDFVRTHFSTLNVLMRCERV